MKTVDTYNITTFDNDGAPDLAITGVSTKIAQSWTDELDAAGVEYYIELVVKQVEETV